MSRGFVDELDENEEGARLSDSRSKFADEQDAEGTGDDFAGSI